ncbi:hypothetical protein KKH3_15170 [Pectobacterium actinidiae]|nr:hypothetical protein KKH3_15170 [Pectobacterium actinidiae]
MPGRKNIGIGNPVTLLSLLSLRIISLSIFLCASTIVLAFFLEK